MRDEPVYRGILAIDIERFSRAEWTHPVRKRLRGRLHRLVDDALTRAEIDPSLTARSDTGDGLWLLVGPEVSTARLLHPLATGLTSDAATSNQHAPGTEQMRLRMVVHAGELLQDPYGHTGASFNQAAVTGSGSWATAPARRACCVRSATSTISVARPRGHRRACAPLPSCSSNLASPTGPTPGRSAEAAAKGARGVCSTAEGCPTDRRPGSGRRRWRRGSGRIPAWRSA